MSLNNYVCLNPNCLNNSESCTNFETPNRCLKDEYCDWKKGLNFDAVRERCFTRNMEEINH